MSTAPKIPAEHPFLNREVILNISNGVIETLQTMAGVKSEFEKAFTEKNWKPNNDVSVFLDLTSEPFTGQIRFHFNKIALSKLYEKLLGTPINADAPEVLDCLGEVSNMCYGFAKAKLNEKGYKLQMTIPHPCKTEELPEVVSAHPHIIIPFKVFNEACQIQVVIF